MAHQAWTDAKPSGWSVIWPTPKEYAALMEAKRLFDARGEKLDGCRCQGHCNCHDAQGYHFVFVEEMHDGVPKVAAVKGGRNRYGYVSGIYINSCTETGKRKWLAQWEGVPRLADDREPQAAAVHSHSNSHTHVDARQWHSTTIHHHHNHASAQGAAMPSRGPHYINAQPHNDFIDHWPTPEEAEALAAAKREADRLFARGHRGVENTGKVRVRGGNGAVASVWRDAPQSYAAFIQAPNPATASGWMTIKGWWGVPEYSDYGIRDTHPATQGDSMSRHRVPGGEVHINAPGPQVHHLYEDIHLVHQRRFHHHRGADEHIHHGIPPEPARIDIAPTRVSVEHAPAAEHHHEAPRGFWATVFLGPKKQQAALPAPAAEEYRGALQSVPTAATALPAPQGRSEALPAPSAPTRAALPAPSHADALSFQVEQALAAPSRQALPVPGGWFSKARR